VETAVDVIVVGGGNAALVTALAAREAGAEGIVLEAAPKDLRGGNSRFTGGIFRVVHDGLEDLLPLVTEQSASWADRVAVQPWCPRRGHAHPAGSGTRPGGP
jgi:tricarballylate dehydrogenase